MIAVRERSMTWDRTLVVCLLILHSKNPDMQATRLLNWGLLLGCCAYLLLGRFDFTLRFTSYMKWFATFFGICTLSIFWAIDSGAVIEQIKSLIVVMLAIYVIMINIRSLADVREVMKAYVGANVLNAVYLMIMVDMATLGAERLGADNAGEGWNANSIGMAMALGIGMLLFLAGKKNWLLALAGSAIMLVPFIYTGSRKAWALLALLVIVMVFVWSPKKIVRNIVLSLCVIVVIYYIIMEVPLIYNIVGYRFEGLFNGLGATGGNVDHSTWLRQQFVRLGMGWFGENPFVGYGLNCYRALLKQSVLKMSTYSHNNYVELLVGLGVVGTVIFYSIYLYLFYNTVKHLWDSRYQVSDRLKGYLLFFAGLLISQLAMHTGMVAYTGMETHLILLLMTKIITFCQKDVAKKTVREQKEGKCMEGVLS